MQIEVFKRREFGNLRTYPANDAAKLVLELTGKGTITEQHIIILKELGLEIIVVPDPLSVSVAT